LILPVLERAIRTEDRMSFREQLDEAKRQWEAAIVEQARAASALTEAAKRFWMLTGAYRGLAAFDDLDQVRAKVDDNAEVTSAEAGTLGSGYKEDMQPHPRPSGKRAPKGSGKRRTAEIINKNEGLSTAAIAALAEATGDPIPIGTLRRALSDLVLEERIIRVDDLWYPTSSLDPGVEAAGSSEGPTAASVSRDFTKEDAVMDPP
jgi:hypothetical protein